ncbi:hypothetical protein ACHAXT_000696 [Thalassiosira profunda]
MATLADRCAACAIEHYHRELPSNTGGKPQTGREWTVYAAIVACRRGDKEGRDAGGGGCSGRESDLWVVACGTGSKCTSVRSTVSTLPSVQTTQDEEHCSKGSKQRAHKRKRPVDLADGTICQCYNGLVLKDSHAETLARRGLVACLWEEIEESLRRIATPVPNEDVNAQTKTDETRQLLEVRPPSEGDAIGSTTFRLKRNISLHMYVSDSPCGDSAIYDIRRNATQQSAAEASKEGDVEVNFTGAKLILGGDQERSSVSPILPNAKSQSTITLGREDAQRLGALRIKSSRSNIPPKLRTTSMSCSDKLVRWGVFGMQGSLLSSYIPEPICLTSIYVSRDPRSVDGGSCGGQLVALERALHTRIESALKLQPSLGLRPPTVAVVDQAFDCSKSASECRYLEAQTNERVRKRQKSEDGNAVACGDGRRSAKKESACGMSMNWHQEIAESDAKKSTEITIGATGLKRGKKPKTPPDVLRSASRLCRFNFLDRAQRCKSYKRSIQPEDCHPSISQAEKASSYGQFKQRWGCTTEKERFQGPLNEWVRSGKDDDFMMPSATSFKIV